ncbi:MAG: hypothetical protein PHI23_04495, partial [Candidatus Peribacteraceae bacterium]|nr:hypothetical protein [Candidatus Peribacteraceae bacterium]
ASVYAERFRPFLDAHREHIVRLGKLQNLVLEEEKHVAGTGTVSMFLRDAEVHIPLEGVLDVEKVRKNLSEELQNLERFLSSVRAKLGNEQFIARAKPEVVETERQKLADGEAKLKKIEERLKALAR